MDVKNRLYELEINYILVEEEPPAPLSGGGGSGTGGIIPNIPAESEELEDLIDEDVPLSALSGAGLFLTRKKREDEE